MITELFYNSQVFKLDTAIPKERLLFGKIQEDNFQEYLINKGYTFAKCEEYSNFDFYTENDKEAVIIELKSSAKNINDYETELINEAKISGIYDKINQNRKRNIKTRTFVIYSYINHLTNENIYKLYKIKWEDLKTFDKSDVFGKTHYLIPKKCFEPIENIDKYLINFKKLIATN